MLRAASTASRTVSMVLVASATARILESTYSASFRMYSGSDPRRLYAWSKISTRTLAFCGSFTDRSFVAVAILVLRKAQPATPLSTTGLAGFGNRFNLRQHLLDATA